MRSNPILLITALLLFCLAATAQDDARYRISLNSGSFTPTKNINTSRVSELNRRSPKPGNKLFAAIQFEQIPSAAEREELKKAGIELLEYISSYAYTVTISKPVDAVVLNRVKARALIELTPQQKMQPSLAKGIIPNRIISVAGTIDVWISYPRTYSYDEVSAELKKANFDVLSSPYSAYRIIALRIATGRLNELAALSCVEYVQGAPKEDVILNNKSIANTHANVLQSSLPGGRNLKGEGVVIGVGDDSNPDLHIDLNARIINRAAIAAGTHGIHVMGTAAGAGLVNEKYAGYAPKSKVIVQLVSGILSNAPAYVQDYGMVITNNSYGNVVDDCATFGVYDLYSHVLDQQAFQMPSLQHVFSAGNNGTSGCGVYPGTFGNVLGGFQTAKNVISVGNGNETFGVSPGSSKGPVRDGRIKPEIVAQGTNVVSSVPLFTYFPNSGTSMSAPAVSGGLALLYERYRQLHGNSNPKNGLMKAILCNGATDMGNAGPDYTYGFGWMNLLRSVKMIEQNNFFNTSVNAGSNNIHTINIPSGSNIAQLKIMLYWNDSAASVLSSPTLVNDLDLEVTDPASATHLPLLLDTVPANITNIATTGADHFNNIEQVVINNPATGSYSFSVKGTTIPSGTSHEYFLVFDTIPVSTKLTFPVGGEHFEAQDTMYIAWESYGNISNDFNLEFFDGASWSNTNPSSSAAGTRQMKWQIPAGIVTDQARIRLTHNSTGEQDVSAPFTIIGTPIDSLTADQCEGYIKIGWRPVAGATDYEVMLLRRTDTEMIPVAVVSSSPYVFSGLARDSGYWVSVRARVNGSPGRRSIAIPSLPNYGNCAGNISDNDLKVDALLAPASGRVFTSTGLTAGTTISARIKNLDNAPVTGFNLKYSVNNAAFVTDPVSTTVAGGNVYTHNFSIPYDFSAVGTYAVRIVVENTSAVDPVSGNDTMTVLIKQLPNAPITLTTTASLLDDFESAADSSYLSGQMGLADTARYDFVTSTGYGRLRTFVNSGMAYSGNRALTLDMSSYYGGGNADSLKATYNLAGHNTTSDDIRLDFMYKHHGQLSNAANRAWIRGNDQQPWIEAFNLETGQEEAGIFRRSPSIEVSDLLVANAQTFSSSFQLRFGQWGQFITADDLSGAGYTFDDLHLYLVDNDMQMVSIDTPIVASCGLGNMVPVRISVRNSSNSTITNIPVKVQVDNGTIINDIIPSISGNTTASFTFSTTVDISAIGNHTVKAWTDLLSDTYHVNDTTETSIYNSPVVTSFPYLQNFEASDGGFYSTGKNSSWEYGTPASVKINRAASGSKAWKTSLAGNYNDLEESYLYSPCFDITGMSNPTLSLSIALDLEDCGSTLCDIAYVEYSADVKTWVRLGAVNQGTNWYDKNYSSNHVWSIEGYTHWHVATIPLPTGIDLLRFRFVVKSDPYVSKEGIAIDDIHVYNNPNGIYTGPPLVSAVSTQAAVSGSSWVDFTTGGKLIASVNPNGQTLGNTDVQAYINAGAVRISSGQYYHDRNITIKPANVNLADSATVRFYFLDSETDTLINARGCAGCSKPSTAYDLGVTKYSDGDDSKENGVLADNVTGNWLFIAPVNCVKVPFDKGYYAEFKVKDFSEFWLNNGGIQNNLALPVELISFNATRQTNNDVVADWITASENNTLRFEIELAKNNDAFAQNHFVKIGAVNSAGNSTTRQSYKFTDQENNKSGIRYYRLRIVDQDGKFTYSPVRPVMFNDEIKWQLYPNPSEGIFNLIYQAKNKEIVQVKVFDLNGKLVKQVRVTANGFVQKAPIDLTEPKFASGMYLLEATMEGRREVFRMLKK